MAVVTAADKAKAVWAWRTPAAAKAERNLRKARAELISRYGHKNQGTPETHAHGARHNEGALARLCKKGTIDKDQLAAAEEIAKVYERIGAPVRVRTASCEARVDKTRMGDGTFFERLGQVRGEVAYGEWRARLGKPAAVLEMIVGDADNGPIGYSVVAARHGMSAKTARRLLIAALDLWREEIWYARRRIDQEDLDAAHARLARG